MSQKSLDSKMYLKLAELKVALDKELNEQYIEKMIQNDFDINYRVPPHLTGMSGLNGLTALHLAQHERSIDIAKLFLRYGADFTIKNSQGSTALHAAMERAYQHEIYTAFPLLKATHDFADLILSAHIQSENFNNPCNNNGISHFHAACIVNNVEAVRFFLDHGVSVNQAIDTNSTILPGYTALHLAIKFYNLETVDLLLQYKVDVHVKNSKGRTPIQMCLEQKIEMYSTMYKNIDSINDLVRKKPQISDQILYSVLQKYSPIDDIGLSHLHISCTMADSSLTRQLLEQRVNINHSLNMSSPVFAGYTALHFAVQCNIDTVKLLITRGANMDFKDSNGLSPLDFCTYEYKFDAFYNVFSCHPVWKDILLVDNKTRLLDMVGAIKDSKALEFYHQNFGPNLNLQLIPSNSPLWPGYTLLHLAVTLSNKRTWSGHRQRYCPMRECLKKGAVVSTQDSFGSTPLHLAFQKKVSVGFKPYAYLTDCWKETMNPINQDDFSLLHILCADRNYPSFYESWSEETLDLVTRILQKDKTENKQSHIAYKGRTIGAKINGSTPLHFSVNDFEKTKLLIEFGADIYAADAQGFTPIHRLIEIEDDSDNEINEAGEILLATPDLKDFVVNSIGLSHLHVASHLDKVDSLEKLLDRGADINLQISPELPAEFSFLAKYAGFTALHVAVSQNNKKAVDYLVRHGADMFAENANGLPLLYEILSSTQGKRLKPFLDTLKSNYTLQKRFNRETGLTMFHVACHQLDVDLIKHYLLKAGANVNAQALENSPIWPGFTALHILKNTMRFLRYDDLWGSPVSAEDKKRHDDIVDGVLKILLDHAADVTLADANQKTALHVFFQNVVTACKKDYARVSLLLKTQKDFSINSTDSEGMSHFHIACGMNDFVAVQKFLKHGCVDVNEPNNRGDTPLHLSCGSSVVKFAGSTAHLKTIQLLLKHGARIDVKNNLGNTALYEATSSRSIVSLKIFEKLLKAGADANSENIFHSTPLELLCKSDMISANLLKIFTGNGYHFNAFNPISNEGFIGLILCVIARKAKWNSTWKAVLTLPEVTKKDNMGRSVIHNVVSSNYTSSLDSNSPRPELTYGKIIEQLENLGCDIDTKDKEGETALHKAAKFSNDAAVSALLEAGADVNAVDKNGKTALAHAFEPYLRSKNAVLDSNAEMVNRMLLQQLVILQHFDLQVCQINRDIQTLASEIRNLNFANDNLSDALKKANYVKISDSLTLRRFLFEETIFTYPYKSLSHRGAVRAFVQSLNVNDSEFAKLKPVINMQFRKAEKRINLVKDAIGSLRSLSNSPVPDVCSRIIFECLRNADLENLILAAFGDNV